MDSAPDRVCEISRTTKETDIKVRILLDGSGSCNVETGCGFLDHMLSLFGAHGLFDLTVAASGDLQVDCHHLSEDIGICLGEALDRALGDRCGIRRYGHAVVPMDEALATCTVDLSGRGQLVWRVTGLGERVGEMDTEAVPEFFAGFARASRSTLHVDLAYGQNTHHMLEAIFKAYGRALSEAVEINPRQGAVPSTKGVL
ncbi:MAG: imidazoleglycerol-phosphate dehydratase HisB [Clostridia bacterium]|nr:imidazoleglycerol-phosphate dehydratase HisB [Clostridia bacterium]